MLGSAHNPWIWKNTAWTVLVLAAVVFQTGHASHCQANAAMPSLCCAGARRGTASASVTPPRCSMAIGFYIDCCGRARSIETVPMACRAKLGCACCGTAPMSRPFFLEDEHRNPLDSLSADECVKINLAVRAAGLGRRLSISPLVTDTSLDRCVKLSRLTL